VINIRDPWDLKRQITKYYIEKNAADKEIRSGSANLSPSLILTSDQGPYCDLFLGYKLVGTPGTAKIDPSMRRRMDAGSAMHKLYQKIILQIYGPNRVRIEKEARIPELYLRMFADAELDERHGLEIKTASAKVFDSVVRAGKPQRKHQDQGLFLFKGLGWESLSFLYINMDSLNDLEVSVMLEADYIPDEYLMGELAEAEMAPIVTTFDADRWEYFRSRIVDKVLSPIDDEGIAPEKTEGSWCWRCPYVQPCKEGVW